MDLETKAEPNVQQAIPFFSVSNIEESVRYYVERLDFTMTRKWIVEGRLRWCWLQIGNAALMLQEFPREGHDSRTPGGKSAKESRFTSSAGMPLRSTAKRYDGE